jgi:hypothetical protein
MESQQGSQNGNYSTILPVADAINFCALTTGTPGRNTLIHSEVWFSDER